MESESFGVVGEWAIKVCLFFQWRVIQPGHGPRVGHVESLTGLIVCLLLGIIISAFKLMFIAFGSVIMDYNVDCYPACLLFINWP